MLRILIYHYNLSLISNIISKVTTYLNNIKALRIQSTRNAKENKHFLLLICNYVLHVFFVRSSFAVFKLKI